MLRQAETMMAEEKTSQRGRHPSTGSCFITSHFNKMLHQSASACCFHPRRAPPQTELESQWWGTWILQGSEGLTPQGDDLATLAQGGSSNWLQFQGSGTGALARSCVSSPSADPGAPPSGPLLDVSSGATTPVLHSYTPTPGG